MLPPQAELFMGDVTRPNALHGVLDGVDAIVFTLGSGGDGSSAKDIDYGGVRNVLAALGDRKPRIALMTAIGVTKRVDARLGPLEGHDWKRRSERLVRASGCPYTIVRPGWFDYNAADQHRLVLLQGDTRWASDPSDGVVARQQIAEVLVRSLSSAAAGQKTFELVAERGEATHDFDALFAPLESDRTGSLDAVRDKNNMPLAEEPAWVREDLATRLGG
ncbi:NAD(P)H-binding [Variovorax sp. YR266]|nr:NAD(P)H-binding [Variovorax sp. YR266]